MGSAGADRTVPLPVGGLSYIQGLTRQRLINKTVGQCLEAIARRVPDREALVVPQENIRLTFAQLKEEVDKAASGLLSIGLRKGDRLGMWGPNSYAWVLMQLATAQAGIILVSVNPAYQAMELEYALKKVGCKAVTFPKQFKTQQYYNILKQICPELEKAQPGALKSQRLPDLTTVISVDDPLPGALLLDEVVAAGSTEQHLARLRYTQQFLSCHDPINIQFTSGTTGSPKGATLSHYNIVNNSNMIGDRLRLHLKTSEDLRIILPSPLYHCLGSVGGTMVSLMYGATLILPCPTFDGKKALEAISKERGTILYGTPTMFVDILNQPDFSSYDISSMCGGVIAGSPAPPELIRAIIDKLNMKELVVDVFQRGHTHESTVRELRSEVDNAICGASLVEPLARLDGSRGNILLVPASWPRHHSPAWPHRPLPPPPPPPQISPYCPALRPTKRPLWHRWPTGKSDFMSAGAGAEEGRAASTQTKLAAIQ
ncbi:medium-chain acyl-CoA ligase ACSF2 [Prionailurus iriomotensis]